MLQDFSTTGLRGGALALGLLAFASTAYAGDCPGNPDAIGTSRTIVVDPTEHPRIGRMQYEEILPLRDHEVVLTFDDGPLPAHSKPVLDILAAQCVKATFFLVGRMAKAFPESVKRLHEAGHTIGTHSQNHPTGFNHFPLARAQQEIDDGIASVKAALGDSGEIAPFFRFPGLGRSAVAEDYLASRGIMTWSADFPADDWLHIPASRVYSLAISRLEAKGKGVLLLHDIQARTQAALPNILRELKARGYRIVHVVPATPDLPKTPTEPREWRPHGLEAPTAAVKWPTPGGFLFVNARTTPAPRIGDLGVVDTKGRIVAPQLTRVSVRRGKVAIPLPPDPVWPRSVSAMADQRPSALAIPAESLFRMDRAVDQIAILPAAVRRADNPAPTLVTAAPAAASADKIIPGSWPIRGTQFANPAPRPSHKPKAAKQTAPAPTAARRKQALKPA